MGAGKPLTPRQQRRIERAVARAEDATGLEFCVYVGPVEGEPREQAEALFARLGLPDRPGILLLVAPHLRRFELLTSALAAQRVSDRDCAVAAVALRASFGVGDLAGGICEAIRLLAQAAGNGPDTTPELPDLLQVP